MTTSASAGNQQIVAEGFRRDQAQRFAHVAADHVVLAHFKRAAVAGAHVECRMMAEHGCHRHLHVVVFVVFEDLPQMARRSVERRGVLRFNFHAVVREVVDPRLAVFGDGRENDIRTAIHFVMAHDRDLVKIDFIADHGVLFDRRVLSG